MGTKSGTIECGGREFKEEIFLDPSGEESPFEIYTFIERIEVSSVIKKGNGYVGSGRKIDPFLPFGLDLIPFMHTKVMVNYNQNGEYVGHTVIPGPLSKIFIK